MLQTKAERLAVGDADGGGGHSSFLNCTTWLLTLRLDEALFRNEDDNGASVSTELLIILRRHISSLCSVKILFVTMDGTMIRDSFRGIEARRKL